MPSRRTLLLGGGAAALAAAGALVVPHALSDEEPAPEPRTQPEPTPAAAIEPGPVVRGSFVSAHRLDQRVEWSLVRPPEVPDAPPVVLPVVLALHGHGGSTAALLDDVWDLPEALARATADGVPPFAIATVNGGNTFWHPRPTGEDAGAMVVDEFLPLLARRARGLGVDPGRLALLGWSMGGYGVLRLTPILDARPGTAPVAAVVASSPGLYTDPALAHPDGFADEAEYERWSVMADQASLGHTPLKIDVGTDDDFCDAVRVYVGGFAPDADVTAQFLPGEHSIDFSAQVLPAELAFLGEHLGGPA